ncbi:MAG: ATP-dependent DNA helicase [Thaumarchaeota archaeon]|nr:ATP-dependent DNA helicase [Nitrososphaerota archaeon]
MAVEERFAYQTFRPGQRELAQRVYEACAGSGILLAEAMSGFGKTAAVLSGALAAAEETGCRVVYTCRTKRQIHRVVEEISRLQKKHPFKAASMLSKFDYCLLRRQRPVPQESFGWYCSFNVSNNLCSYFLNVPLVGAGMEEMVNGAVTASQTHSELLRASESLHVCPYEVTRLAMVQATVAVAPYHYVFDPRAAAVLFDRNSLDRRKAILVVDEAHNLRDFLRGIHSSTLTFDEVDGAVREAEALLMDEAAASLRTLREVLGRAVVGHASWLLDRQSILERFRDEKGTAWLQNLAFELSACSAAAWGSIAYERRLPSLVLRVGDFLAKLSAEGPVMVKWDRTMGLIDPDPVSGLEACLKEFKSSVLLSATINPSSVFSRSLGLAHAGTSTYEVKTESAVTVRTIVDKGVSTRYKLRTPEMFAKISDKIAAVVRGTDAGVGVFAPSYSVLGAVFDMVTKRVGDRHLVREVQGLSSQEAADVFDSFRSSEGSVLFGVQAGRFSEGEDFNEEIMGAVIVVGLSLPPPSPLLYAEYACLKRAGEPDSFLMLSRLPALRKAFQAAGRHVRSPGKRGMVFLFDERFDSQVVVDLMPSWLRSDLLVGDFTPQSLEGLAREFWAYQR